MPSNRTVAEPTISAGVTDVTEQTQRALSRAAFEARKQNIASLVELKSQVKAELDDCNHRISMHRETARAAQAQIDKIDEAIEAAKANG